MVPNPNPSNVREAAGPRLSLLLLLLLLHPFRVFTADGTGIAAETVHGLGLQVLAQSGVEDHEDLPRICQRKTYRTNGILNQE
jgi:hypothetical protein